MQFSKFTRMNLIVVSILLICILGIASWSVQKKIQASAKMEVSQSLNAILDSTHHSVKSWANEHKKYVSIWSNFATTREFTQKLLLLSGDIKSLKDSSLHSQLRNYLQPLLAEKEHADFCIVSLDHINLSSGRDTKIGTENLLSTRDNFLDNVRNGETILKLPEKMIVTPSDTGGELQKLTPVMYIAAPIQDPSGKIIAAFLLLLNPADDFANHLEQGRIGNSGETYAFDRHARLLSRSRYVQQLRDAGLITKDENEILNIQIRDPGERLMPGKKPAIEIKDRPLTYMAASATRGNSGINLDGYRDYRGVDVVGAWRWDQDLGFGIATEIDATEAYRSARTSQFVIITLTVLVGILLIGLMLFFRVYFKRKLAEQQWRESETRIRLLLESIGEGVFGVDLEGCCTFINTTALNLLGYSDASELIGKYIHPIIHHTNANGNPCNDAECRIYGAFRIGASYFVDDEVLWRSDNTCFYVEYRSTPVYQNGIITGSVASFADVTARREAEHSLRQSELRYRQVFNSISDVYIEIDLDGKILEVSPSVAMHTGYSREELLGRSMGELYAYPEDRDKLLSRLSQEGSINDFEERLIMKDGSVRPFSFTGKIINDESGKPLKLAGVMRDITERKLAEEILKKGTKELETRVQERTRKLESANIVLKHEIEERKLAEKALRENERFIQTVLNTLPDSIAVIDNKGFTISVNNTWNKIANEHKNTGLINTSTGDNYLEYCLNTSGALPSEGKQIYKGINELLNREREQFSIEYACNSPTNNRWYVMHAIPFHDDDIGVVITHTDITESKLSEEAITAERDRAQRYLDTVEAIIVSLDKNGNINLINRKGCQILGYTEQELLGKNWFHTCLPERNRDEVFGVFKKISAGDVSSSEYFENPVITRDGRERMIAWHNSYFMDTDGNFAASLGAGEDITERVRAEERARRHQAEAAHLARLNIAGEMATGIAHELNQPLSAIVTYADVALRAIKSGNVKDDKLTAAIEGARSQANRAADIIRHLRQLVTKQPPKKTKTSLNDLIKESIQLDIGDLRKNQISYSLDLKESLPSIIMDSIQIEQVLLNLINNSIDAMQQVARTKRKLVIQTSLIKDEYAKVTIVDNGPGIDTETQQKIFDPFFTSKGEKGMGLGLSISRSIIENHHGVLTVESKPGHGAKFSFTLPLDKQDQVVRDKIS